MAGDEKLAQKTHIADHVLGVVAKYYEELYETTTSQKKNLSNAGGLMRRRPWLLLCPSMTAPRPAAPP
jgi:hypothetical protein